MYACAFPSACGAEVRPGYTTAGGEFYTGCTTIAEAWDKSFFLGPWYAKEMANAILDAPYDGIVKMTPKQFATFIFEAKGAAKRKSEEAKEDGSLVHDWIESVIGKKIDPTHAMLPIPEKAAAKNSVNSFIGGAKTKSITWLASEEIVSSDVNRTAGKLDAIAVIDGLTYLVDFKTSGQLSSSYLRQCAGYDLMLREMGLQVMGYMIVRIPKDGTPVETLTITNQEDMEFFRQTFLKQREAHKFYVYMESKFKDSRTRKMKIGPKVEPEEVININTRKTNEHSKTIVGKSKGVGKSKTVVSAARRKA